MTQGMMGPNKLVIYPWTVAASSVLALISREICLPVMGPNKLVIYPWTVAASSVLALISREICLPVMGPNKPVLPGQWLFRAYVSSHQQGIRMTRLAPSTYACILNNSTD